MLASIWLYYISPFFIPKKGWYVTNIRVLNSRRRVSNKLNLLKKTEAQISFYVTEMCWKA